MMKRTLAHISKNTKLQAAFDRAIEAAKKTAAGPKRILCRDASIMLRYLPYIGREPDDHPGGEYGWAKKNAHGHWEECFLSERDAKDRFRKLRQERRIESAEIIMEVRDRGGGRGHRILMEWSERRPVGRQ